MATWTRLKRGWSIGRGTASAFGVEFWRTKDLDFNDIAANTLLLDPQLPQTGQMHPDPDMKGAMCVSTRVVRGPEGKACTVQVIYSAVNAYSGGPMPSADFSGDPVAYSIPRIRDDTGSVVGPFARSISYMTIQRARCIRCRTLQTVGDEIKAATLNAAILPNYGKAYGFSDGAYILHSHRLVWIQTGQISITYRFWRWAPILGFAAAPPKWPIETPPLGTLDEYGAVDALSIYDPDFAIPVLLGSDRYLAGDPLP